MRREATLKNKLSIYLTGKAVDMSKQEHELEMKAKEDLEAVALAAQHDQIKKYAYNYEGNLVDVEKGNVKTKLDSKIEKMKPWQPKELRYDFSKIDTYLDKVLYQDLLYPQGQQQLRQQSQELASDEFFDEDPYNDNSSSQSSLKMLNKTGNKSLIKSLNMQNKGPGDGTQFQFNRNMISGTSNNKNGNAAKFIANWYSPELFQRAQTSVGFSRQALPQHSKDSQRSRASRGSKGLKLRFGEKTRNQQSQSLERSRESKTMDQSRMANSLEMSMHNWKDMANASRGNLQEIANKTDYTYQKLNKLKTRPKVYEKHYLPRSKKREKNYKVNLSSEELYSISQITVEEFKAYQGKKESEIMNKINLQRQGELK